MKYSVNEEGVQALKSLSNALDSSIESIVNCSSQIRTVSDEYSDTIGPHKSSLDQSIENIIEYISQSADPANDIAERLCEVAEGYQEIIDNDRLKSESAESDFQKINSGGQSTSFLGRLFGGKKEAQSTHKFGSFETGTYRNGVSVVKGENFEQYMIDYYDYENSIYEPLDENSIVETISPGKIEGIYLGSTEMEDNSRFWGRMSGGTADSFKEIASRIPEVKSQIDAGKSLAEIRNNPDLEKCVDIYFEPSNMPRVVKSNGYYEFNSNGRHRILAARELGHNIPVRIIGIRRYK